MDLHVDFKELLECFNARKIEYVVVGGYARAAHGAPQELPKPPRCGSVGRTSHASRSTRPAPANRLASLGN